MKEETTILVTQDVFQETEPVISSSPVPGGRSCDPERPDFYPVIKRNTSHPRYANDI